MIKVQGTRHKVQAKAQVSRIKIRFKAQDKSQEPRLKNQYSRLKIQESRIKIQGSRLKGQGTIVIFFETTFLRSGDVEDLIGDRFHF
jgi:hypothetical protein